MARLCEATYNEKDLPINNNSKKEQFKSDQKTYIQKVFRKIVGDYHKRGIKCVTLKSIELA